MNIERSIGIAGVLVAGATTMFMLSDIQLSRAWIVGLLGVHVSGVVFLLGLSIWKITLPVLFSASKKDMLQRLNDTETYATYRIVQQSQKAR